MQNPEYQHGERITLHRPEEVREAESRLHERIRARAYERHRARGGVHGYDVEDWLLAEQEVATCPVVAFRTLDASLHVDVALPAVAARMLRLALSADRLIVHAAHGHAHGLEQGPSETCELCARPIHRSIALPQRVVAASGRAELHHGVLTVTARLDGSAEAHSQALEAPKPANALL